MPESQRWVIERTIAWLNRYRRLGRDYEKTVAASETWIRIAATRLALGKLERV